MKKQINKLTNMVSDFLFVLTNNNTTVIKLDIAGALGVYKLLSMMCTCIRCTFLEFVFLQLCKIYFPITTRMAPSHLTSLCVWMKQKDCSFMYRTNVARDKRALCTHLFIGFNMHVWWKFTRCLAHCYSLKLSLYN